MPSPAFLEVLISISMWLVFGTTIKLQNLIGDDWLARKRIIHQCVVKMKLENGCGRGAHGELVCPLLSNSSAQRSQAAAHAPAPSPAQRAIPQSASLQAGLVRSLQRGMSLNPLKNSSRI